MSAAAAPQLESVSTGNVVPSIPAGTLPLCVDLDGTLIKTDLLVESALALVKQRLIYLFLIPLWLLRGKAYFKQQLSERVDLNPAALPYREPVLEWLKAEDAAGRVLVLATGSHAKPAQAVAAHLGLFDLVLATSETLNLVGSRKRDALVERFGARGFAYAGDAAVDLAIWDVAQEAIVVAAAPSVERAARKTGRVSRTFPREAGQLKAFVKAIRVKQWLKNLLVFLPVFTAHKLSDPHLLLRATIAFIAFSFCASAVYLANDLMDLEADRRHRSKKNRPFAAGTLPLTTGLAAVPLLLGLSFGLASSLSLNFIGILGLYFAITNAYTFVLKREALIDVICLAGLYTIRIFAGAASTDLPVSMWLSALSMFGFLSLALVKRVSELRVAKDSSEQSLRGRGYQVGDLGMLEQAGISTGYTAVLVFALYIHGEEVKALYSHPATLWFICPLMFYWVSRVWLLTHRGQMHDDPVEFAVYDRISHVIAVLAVMVVYLAR